MKITKDIKIEIEEHELCALMKLVGSTSTNQRIKLGLNKQQNDLVERLYDKWVNELR